MRRKTVRPLLLLILIVIGLPLVLQRVVLQEAISQDSERKQTVAARVDGQPIGTVRLEQ